MLKPIILPLLASLDTPKPPGGHVSVRILVYRLPRDYLIARRVVKRPALTSRHRLLRFQRANDRRRWNISSLQTLHWLNKSLFLLLPTDGKIRVLQGNQHLSNIVVELLKLSEYRSYILKIWNLKNMPIIYIRFNEKCCSSIFRLFYNNLIIMQHWINYLFAKEEFINTNRLKL